MLFIFIFGSRAKTHFAPLGLGSGTGNALYTFRPAGTATLMSDIFSLSYNTVRNSQKKNSIVNIGSTCGAECV